MDHVEPDPCFNLAGKQDGSVPMSSQIEHEWNPSGNITVFDSEVLTQPRPNGAGEGGINSVPIQSRKGSQVEQEPCDTLYGRMDGSDPISSKIHPEGNASGNITIISDQVLAQPWPKGKRIPKDAPEGSAPSLIGAIERALRNKCQ